VIARRLAFSSSRRARCAWKAAAFSSSRLSRSTEMLALTVCYGGNAPLSPARSLMILISRLIAEARSA
jgi:hypothetical protein